jgi:hypothetical protein
MKIKSNIRMLIICSMCVFVYSKDNQINCFVVVVVVTFAVYVAAAVSVSVLLFK